MTTTGEQSRAQARDDIVAAYPSGDPITELAQKWENATELGSGAPSIVTQAFAAELRAAMQSSSAVPLALYSAALDEIYRLREALAYEAGGIENHTSYATFPKSRRSIAAQQIERMRSAARGDSQVAYAGLNSAVLRGALREAGAPDTLTRWQFEQQVAPKRD